jgi:hypothetical protein
MGNGETENTSPFPRSPFPPNPNAPVLLLLVAGLPPRVRDRRDLPALGCFHKQE